jgi:hypothetical protein
MPTTTVTPAPPRPIITRRRSIALGAIAAMIIAAPLIARQSPHAGTGATTVHRTGRAYALTAQTGTEGAAEHAAIRRLATVHALTARVGTEGAAEHAAAQRAAAHRRIVRTWR